MAAIPRLHVNATPPPATWRAFGALWIGFATFVGILQLTILGITSVVISLFIYATYGLLAGRLGRLIRTRHQALLRNRFFAVLFAGAGIALACTGRR